MGNKYVNTSVAFTIPVILPADRSIADAPLGKQAIGWFPPGNGIYFKWESQCYNYSSVVYVTAL